MFFARNQLHPTGGRTYFLPPVFIRKWSQRREEKLQITENIEPTELLLVCRN